jgi:hypothetical protein
MLTTFFSGNNLLRMISISDDADPERINLREHSSPGKHGTAKPACVTD